VYVHVCVCVYIGLFLCLCIRRYDEQVVSTLMICIREVPIANLGLDPRLNVIHVFSQFLQVTAGLVT
jgi:hypothetical protein